MVNTAALLLLSCVVPIGAHKCEKVFGRVESTDDPIDVAATCRAQFPIHVCKSIMATLINESPRSEKLIEVCKAGMPQRSQKRRKLQEDELDESIYKKQEETTCQRTRSFGRTYSAGVTDLLKRVLSDETFTEVENLLQGGRNNIQDETEDATPEPTSPPSEAPDLTVSVTDTSVSVSGIVDASISVTNTTVSITGESLCGDEAYYGSEYPGLCVNAEQEEPGRGTIHNVSNRAECWQYCAKNDDYTGCAYTAETCIPYTDSVVVGNRQDGYLCLIKECNAGSVCPDGKPVCEDGVCVVAASTPEPDSGCGKGKMEKSLERKGDEPRRRRSRRRRVATPTPTPAVVDDEQDEVPTPEPCPDEEEGDALDGTNCQKGEDCDKPDTVDSTTTAKPTDPPSTTNLDSTVDDKDTKPQVNCSSFVTEVACPSAQCVWNEGACQAAQCTDTNNGAYSDYGGYGYDCASAEWWPSECGSWTDDTDYTSDTMCCACGGGSASAATPAKPAEEVDSVDSSLEGKGRTASTDTDVQLDAETECRAILKLMTSEGVDNMERSCRARMSAQACAEVAQVLGPFPWTNQFNYEKCREETKKRLKGRAIQVENQTAGVMPDAATGGQGRCGTLKGEKVAALKMKGWNPVPCS